MISLSWEGGIPEKKCQNDGNFYSDVSIKGLPFPLPDRDSRRRSRCIASCSTSDLWGVSLDVGSLKFQREQGPFTRKQKP